MAKNAEPYLLDFEFLFLQPEQEAARWWLLEAIECVAPEVLRDLADGPCRLSHLIFCLGGRTLCARGAKRLFDHFG